jgi:hypothetical protein
MDHKLVIEVLNKAEWIRSRDDGTRYVDRSLFVNCLGFLFGGVKIPTLPIPGGKERLLPNIPPAEMHRLLRVGLLRLSGPVGVATAAEHQSRRALLQQLPEIDLMRETKNAGRPYGDWPHRWDDRIKGLVRDTLRRRVLEASSVYETGQGFREWGFVYWRPIKFASMAPPTQVKVEFWMALDMEEQDVRVDRGRRCLFHPTDELALAGDRNNSDMRESSAIKLSSRERGHKRKRKQ